MAPIPRDNLNISGYVYPLSLSKGTPLEPAVDSSPPLLGSCFECGKTDVIAQTKKMILLETCQMLVCFWLKWRDLSTLLLDYVESWQTGTLEIYCLSTFRLLNRRKANVMVICRKLFHLEKCFASSRHCHLPERTEYLFSITVFSWGILQGQMCSISSWSNK